MRLLEGGGLVELRGSGLEGLGGRGDGMVLRGEMRLRDIRRFSTCNSLSLSDSFSLCHATTPAASPRAGAFPTVLRGEMSLRKT